MPQKLTTEYNMENWREATRDWKFVMYSTEGYEKIPATLYIQDISFPNGLHSETDSERNFSEVSPKRAIPIGENIRDAIRSISGR